MAITWNIQITNVNLNSKRADVTATRTDDQSALPPRIYTMNQTPIETQADRVKVLDTIKEWDTVAVANKDQINAFIGTLEQSAKSNLEAWELTR